jgi:hypothetical protein
VFITFKAHVIHLVTIASLASLSQWKTDGAKKLANQIALKGYFAGEAAGVRLASHKGRILHVHFGS